MKGPKVTVIGAGSYFFGRPVIWNMTHSKFLRNGTLALVDTDPHVLKTMMALGRKAVRATRSKTRIIGSTDRRKVLKNSDFVIFTFSWRNAHFRGLDCEIASKYGIRMCSGDTIGPGGIFRALREIPKALAMAKDAAELAPDSWVINFVNPTSVLGIALMRYASNVRSFAICDGLHEPHYRLSVLKNVGILPNSATDIPPEIEARLNFKVGGVNHFTWITRFEYKGRNMMPALRKWLVQRARKELNDAETIRNTGKMDNNASSKIRFNDNYSLQLLDTFGAYPNRIAHTKEYVPYFQGLGVEPVVPEPIGIFDAEERTHMMNARWKETEDYAYGRKPVKEFIRTGRGDHATDIIESMWGGLKKPFYINTANRGAVTNMADDAFLELRCDLDMNGPRPQPFGEMPRGLLGMQQCVLDTHELTAEAAVTCDRRILLRALATDPIVNNIADAKAIMEESLKRERAALDKGWYK